MLLLLVLPIFAVALDADDAKADWREVKTISQDKQAEHQDAKLDYAADPTEENNQLVIDTGKEVLDAALNEVEAWLIWKNLEAEENPDVPAEIKENINTKLLLFVSKTHFKNISKIIGKNK